MAIPAGIQLQEADPDCKGRILAKWPWVRPRWLHVEDAFTLAAVREGEIVGFLSAKWSSLPPPLAAREGFIDIIEVNASHRRQGIGRGLVQAALANCRRHGACQLRAWSSEDKIEAIPMWKAMGFGLCPATDHPGGQPVRGYFVAYPLP